MRKFCSKIKKICWKSKPLITNRDSYLKKSKLEKLFHTYSSYLFTVKCICAFCRSAKNSINAWRTFDSKIFNQNLDQNSKFWSKIEISVKNQNFGQTRNLSPNSKFWSKNLNVGQKLKYRFKNQNFGQNRNLGKKL